MSTALRQLPLLRWATRFRSGSVELTGRLVSPLAWEGAGGPVTLEAGPVAARVDFVGGATPAMEAAALDAAQITVGSHQGATLAAGPGATALDGVAIDPVRMDLLLEFLLDHVHDLSVEVAAHTERDLIVKVSKGVEATLPAHHVVTLRGGTQGPPEQPLLAAPLVVSVAGTGVRLSHAKLRWLSTLAKVRLQEAQLHPNGRVALHAHARGGSQRLGGGLHRVSERLSEVVRRSPRFARVRAFLRDTREPGAAD